jgi:hypothetical protein
MTSAAIMHERVGRAGLACTRTQRSVVYVTALSVRHLTLVLLCHIPFMAWCALVFSGVLTPFEGVGVLLLLFFGGGATVVD